MSEEKGVSIDDFPVTLEFTGKEINNLLNILNAPLHVPAMTLVAFINLIQQQAAPQIIKVQEGLAAVAKAQDESKATS